MWLVTSGVSYETHPISSAPLAFAIPPGSDEWAGVMQLSLVGGRLVDLIAGVVCIPFA